jgi:hypothetical protein
MGLIEQASRGGIGVGGIGVSSSFSGQIELTLISIASQLTLIVSPAKIELTLRQEARETRIIS